MSFTPSPYLFVREPILVLDKDLMDAYLKAFLPGWTEEQKKDPNVSPLYADLEKLRGRLPPALFTCGTEDCLLDDTVFMSARWFIAGAETVVKIIPGGCHGYIMFPRDMAGSGAKEGCEAVEEFVRQKIG